MNLNKYDSRGFLYTAEEAAQRAHDIFGVNYHVKGYDANPVLGPLGTPLPRALLKPYNVGRNAAKRAVAKSRSS
jgi:hypothetical protein